MRILYVANANMKYNGARNYSMDTKIFNGLVRNGHWVFFFSDRDVARASSIFNSRAFGIKACNQKLIDTFKQFNPDLVVFGHSDIIKPETIAQLREIRPSVSMIQFNVDGLFSPYNIKNIKRRLPYMDATFITTAGSILRQFSNDRGRIFYIPNIIDSSIETGKAFEHNKLPFDIFFAMRSRKENPKESDPGRSEIPFFLTDNLPDLRFAYYGFGGKAKLEGSAYIDTLANSKMGLNLSRKVNEGVFASQEEIFLYSSDRISQYMGNGLLIFVEDDYQLTNLFREDGVVTFTNRGDLLEKIRYYHDNDNERRRIAQNGWERCHSEFNEKLVTQFMVEAGTRQHLSYDYKWPTEWY